MGQVQSFGILNKGSGLWPSGFTWQVTSARLAGDVMQVWINSSPSNHCISHFKAQLTQLFFIQHLKCTYWIKGILCGYAIRSGRHPSGSEHPGPTCGRPGGGHSGTWVIFPLPIYLLVKWAQNIKQHHWSSWWIKNKLDDVLLWPGLIQFGAGVKGVYKTLDILITFTSVINQVDELRTSWMMYCCGQV